jgi:hypothetical protein
MTSLSMRAAAVIFTMALLPVSALPISANAKGCLKGAVVGGVAGHMAGHHGALGAGAGCAIGHHHANKKSHEMKGGTGSSSSRNTSGQTH